MVVVHVYGLNMFSPSLPSSDSVLKIVIKHGQMVENLGFSAFLTTSSACLLQSTNEYKKDTETYEPRHEKTCSCHMRITKAQISLRICTV